MSDDIKPFLPEQLPSQIKVHFTKIYALECEVEALKAEHITPITDEIKAKRRALKGGCDMTSKDIKLAYDLWKRLQQAQKMEDEDEGKRVQADIKRIFAALQKGEMVDFLSVLGADEALKPLAPELLSNGHDDMDGDGEFADADEDEFEEVGGVKPLDLSEDGEKVQRDLSGEPLAEDEPEAEWTAAAESDGNTEVLDGAGFVFSSGREAGEAGKHADANPYDDEQSEQAELWERGRVIGYRLYDERRTQAEASEVAEDMEESGEGDNDGLADIPEFLRRRDSAEVIKHPSAAE